MYFYSVGPVWSHPQDSSRACDKKRTSRGCHLTCPRGHRLSRHRTPHGACLLICCCYGYVAMLKAGVALLGGRLYDMLIITGRWHGTSAGALRGQHALLPRHLG